MLPPEKCYLVGKASFLSWEIFHVVYMIYFNPAINVIRVELGNFVALRKSSANEGLFIDMSEYEGFINIYQFCKFLNLFVLLFLHLLFPFLLL